VSSLAFTPGDLVMTVEDERIGYVKHVDYGGVHVQLQADDDHGPELRVCSPEQLLLNQQTTLFPRS
jgi:hypothetical protein